MVRNSSTVLEMVSNVTAPAQKHMIDAAVYTALYLYGLLDRLLLTSKLRRKGKTKKDFSQTSCDIIAPRSVNMPHASRNAK